MPPYTRSPLLQPLSLPEIVRPVTPTTSLTAFEVTRVSLGLPLETADEGREYEVGHCDNGCRALTKPRGKETKAMSSAEEAKRRKVFEKEEKERREREKAEKKKRDKDKKDKK